MFSCFLWILLLYCSSVFSFEKVVIWGHKLHTHTHSYIHERFYRAFDYLGYPVFWFDDRDYVPGFDFSNTLFLTEGQVDDKIPLRKDCLYILHHCDKAKYEEQLDRNQWIKLGTYTDDLLAHSHLTKVDEAIYYDISGRVVYMPWASDFLPYEIDIIKELLPTRHRGNHVPWIGSYSEGVHGNFDQVTPFHLACKESGYRFDVSNPWEQGIERDEMFSRIFHAYLAPALVGEWQSEKGYIPCRIFINLSCGQLGITNSLRVYEFFNRKIVYNPDTYQLFYDAKKRLETWTLEEQYELMDFIKEKHTYLNRIQTLLDFFDLVNKVEKNT